jgi:hypothetical protein
LKIAHDDALQLLEGSDAGGAALAGLPLPIDEGRLAAIGSATGPAICA